MGSDGHVCPSTPTEALTPKHPDRGISIHPREVPRFSHRHRPPKFQNPPQQRNRKSRHNDASCRRRRPPPALLSIVWTLPHHSSASAHCIAYALPTDDTSLEAWAISAYRLVHRYGRKQLVPPIPFHIFNFRIGGHRFCIYAANG